MSNSIKTLEIKDLETVEGGHSRYTRKSRGSRRGHGKGRGRKGHGHGHKS